MHRFASRLLGASLLLALVGILATEIPTAFAQKKKAVDVKPAYKTDATKKAIAQPTIAAGKKLSATDLAAHIDSFILKKVKAEKVEVSPRCSDEDFLRRVYLDITGKIPTADQATKFLDSKESNKRAKLIDELLASKEYGKHMADIWQSLMLPRNSDNRRFMQWYPNLVTWLEEKFNANTPWNTMVKEIVTSEGAVDKTSPVVYFLANNTADKMTDNITRMFMGVQLQCAQCHNHPFTDYKQDEYWGMAAFFLKVAPDGNPKGAAKNKTTVSISEKAKVGKKKGGLPESAKILPPKFLGAEQPTIKATDPSRPTLAAWMTTAKNPYFSKAMVNRLWGQMFGRGIVNPVDDMHDGNAVSHPELLADLAQQFSTNDFDVKHMIRAICNSDTYQRSSKPHKGNGDAAPELFAKMAVKPLSGEQLFDSLQVVGAIGRGAAPKTKAARGTGNAREQFVNFFSAEDGADVTEYQSGIPQVLRLMNAAQLNNPSSLNSIVRDTKTKEEALERLYLTMLARRPTAEEKDRFVAYMAKTKAMPRTAYGDLMWALMNSSEFALNR